MELVTVAQTCLTTEPLVHSLNSYEYLSKVDVNEIFFEKLCCIPL